MITPPPSEETTCPDCNGNAWDAQGNACKTCKGNGTVGA